MAGNVKWNGAAVQARIEREMGRRLDASAIIVVNATKVLLNVEGTIKSSKGKRAKLIYNANPSKAPDPPHKQTGRLLASMAWERNGLVARVGSNVVYARALELGYPENNLAARPYLHRALNERTAQIRAILTRPMPI